MNVFEYFVEVAGTDLMTIKRSHHHPAVLSKKERHFNAAYFSLVRRP